MINSHKDSNSDKTKFFSLDSNEVSQLSSCGRTIWLQDHLGTAFVEPFPS